MYSEYKHVRVILRAIAADEPIDVAHLYDSELCACGNCRARLVNCSTLPGDYSLVATGGGCRAWQRDLPDGGYVLVTDAEGASGDWSVDDVSAGQYDADGLYTKKLTLLDVYA